jgi:hypothetical protein
MDTGKGGSQQTSGSQELEAFTGELREQSRPVRQEVFNQILEGLKTGGLNAQIPMIQQGVESSRAATSNALRQLDENMAVTGLNRTGFGARARGETLMQGEQRTAQIPFELVQQFITTALGQATGTPTTIVQGLGAASDSQARLGAANTQAQAALMSALFGAGSDIGTAFI